MADSISQADLDALWGSLSENQPTEPPATKKEEPAQQTGISQSDLDALFGQLGGDAPKAAEDTNAANAGGGLSQADLNALWGEAGLSLPEPTPAPTPQQEAASSGSENLSQDDIDRLLAEMGK